MREVDGARDLCSFVHVEISKARVPQIVRKFSLRYQRGYPTKEN